MFGHVNNTHYYSYFDTVDRLGKSSVNYSIGIFKQDQDTASAVGCLTHVFVDRETQKPTAIQGKMREAMVSAMVKV